MDIVDHRPAGVLIVGAGAAGTTAARELRELGYDGPVTLVNGERDAPYNRTAVNKGLLQGQASLASVTLPDLPQDVAVRHGLRVVGLDHAARTAVLEDGERLGYAALLVATGAEPRTLDVVRGPALTERVLPLRTAADAVALRAALERVAEQRGAGRVRVGVVGGGLLGAETAETLAAEGAEVTLIDSRTRPLDRLLGRTVAGWVHGRQAHGIRRAYDVSVLGVHAIGEAVLIRLSDAADVVVDVVLLAAGVTPATAWLSAALPGCGDGVVTDGRLRALGADRIYAAGDVARRQEGTPDTLASSGGHWGMALGQGRHVARTIAHDLGLGADPGTFDAPESFATRLHGGAVTVVGSPGRHVREVVLTGSLDEDAVTVGLVDGDERLVGAVALGRPKALNRIRPLVAERAGVKDALALLDPRVPASG